MISLVEGNSVLIGSNEGGGENESYTMPFDGFDIPDIIL